MAVSTTIYSIGSAWTLVADGKAEVLARLQSGGAVDVFLGAAAPANDGAVKGIVLYAGEGGETEFAASGLVAGDQVHIRSRSGDLESVAVVTA